MKVTKPWLLVALFPAAGCLTTGGAGYGDDGDGNNPADGDADADADGDGACPEYPAGPYGIRAPAPGEEVGDTIAPTFALPGNGPADDTWTMNDFWCMAHRAENPATVVMMNVHSST